MLEILFWVYVASAVLAFLYLFVFATMAVMYFSKECKAEGMVRIKTSTNWAKICIDLLKCSLMIGLPIINTFFVVIWLCNTSSCMKVWKETAYKCYRYPNEF